MLEKEILGISVGRSVAYVNEWGSCATGIVVRRQLIELGKTSFSLYSIELPDGSIEQVQGSGVFGKEDLVLMNSYPEYSQWIEAYITGTGRNPGVGLEKLKSVLSELDFW